MALITVCSHGTGFSSVKGTNQGELVAWVHNNINGGEIKLSGGMFYDGQYLILEGPGHTVLPWDKQVPLPNKVDPTTGGLKRAHRFVPEWADRTVKGIGGILQGHGWDANIARAVNIINVLQQNRQIDTINLIGWSRGAVTCLRLVNALEQTFPNQFAYNIFAVDPVAGWKVGLTEADTYTVPASVHEYVCILAESEERGAFLPQDMSRMQFQDPHTTRSFLPMPGVHNMQVMGQTDVSEVTGNLACALLQRWGTTLNTTFSPILGTPGAMNVAYARMVADRKAYSGHSPNYWKKGLDTTVRGFQGIKPPGRREFNTTANMHQYRFGGKGSYWVNEHHRACFQHDFQTLYTFLTTAGGVPTPLGQWAQEVGGKILDQKGRDDFIASLLTKNMAYIVNQQLMVGPGTAGLGLNPMPLTSWPGFFPRSAA